MDKHRTSRTPKLCERCGKPLPDEESFRKIVISCLKQGFYILDDGTDTKQSPHCLCKGEVKDRLARIRRRRSHVKRKVALILRVKPQESDEEFPRALKSLRKSKKHLLKRGGKPGTSSRRKALQRQMKWEEDVLWDWAIYDLAGDPHYLEDVLDIPFVRELISGNRHDLPEEFDHLHRILSQLATDPQLISFLTQEPWPDEPEDVEPCAEEERLLAQMPKRPIVPYDIPE